VIGVGVKNSTSHLLASNCDEFIYCEDLVRHPKPKPRVVTQLPDKKDVFQLLMDSIEALQREDKEILWGSMVTDNETKTALVQRILTATEASAIYWKMPPKINSSRSRAILRAGRMLSIRFRSRGEDYTFFFKLYCDIITSIMCGRHPSVRAKEGCRAF
jgi:hypothetical protein